MTDRRGGALKGVSGAENALNQLRVGLALHLDEGRIEEFDLLLRFLVEELEIFIVEVEVETLSVRHHALLVVRLSG